MRSRLPARLAAPIAVAALSLAGIAAGTPVEGCYVAIEGDAATADDDVFACETATWIADPAGSKVGNLAVADDTRYPTFSDEEPAASVSSGAGAGYLGTSLLQLNEPDVDATGFTIKGEFTGPIDALAITLHGVHSGLGRLPFSPTGPIPPENPNPTAPVERAGMTAYVSLEVDGMPIIPGQSLAVAFTTDAAPTAAASERYRATITDLANDLYGLDLGAETVHQVTLRVTPRYINTDPAVVYLYGTSEVPSGVVFNPLVLDENVTTVEY